MCPIMSLICPLCTALSAVGAFNRTKNSIERSINHNFNTVVGHYCMCPPGFRISSGSCCVHSNAWLSNRTCRIGPGHTTISSGWGCFLNQMLSCNAIHWGFAVGLFCAGLVRDCSVNAMLAHRFCMCVFTWPIWLCLLRLNVFCSLLMNAYMCNFENTDWHPWCEANLGRLQ